MRICVVDASVMAKWLLSDEDDSSGALELKRDCANGATAIAVPGLVRYEVASLLSTAVKRGRMSVDDASDGLRLVLAMGLIFHDGPETISHALMLANQTGGSVYDCAYLASAISLDCDLYTADRRFIALAGHTYGKLRHINEYCSS